MTLKIGGSRLRDGVSKRRPLQFLRLVRLVQERNAQKACDSEVNFFQFALFAHFIQVANAVGAALSEVSGTFDQVISMDNTTREDARTYAEKEAKRKAVEAGADEKTLEVVDVVDVPLAYLPGNAVRYYLKVIGDLKEIDNSNSQEAFSGTIKFLKERTRNEPATFKARYPGANYFV